MDKRSVKVLRKWILDKMRGGEKGMWYIDVSFNHVGVESRRVYPTIYARVNNNQGFLVWIYGKGQG